MFEIGTERKESGIILKATVFLPILAILVLIYTVVDFQDVLWGTEVSESRNIPIADSESTIPKPVPAKSDDLFLKPPSQDWIQRQMVKSLEIRGLEYSTTNQWKTCGARSYFYPKINTIFTGVPKTGCSNWIEALLRAEGDLTESIDPAKVKIVHGRLSAGHRMGARMQIITQYNNSVFDKAFSFTVVRNPWTRMVSGFRDKLSSEETQGGSFRGIGKNIVRTMRGIEDPDQLDKLYPTFPEFLRWLVIRQTDGKIDGHFAPQWKTLCVPRVKYDYIIPLEYSGPLSKEVWGKMNASNVSLLGSYDKSKDPRRQKSALLAKEWFSEIEQETIEQLYSIYRADFAYMNYSNFTDPNFPLPLYDEVDRGKT